MKPDRITLSAKADVWLEALGVRLVFMTVEQAKAIGAVVCPPQATVH